MKNLFNIAWKAAITLVAFAGFQVAASAQIQQKEVFMDFPDGFTAVNISNEFDVSLVQGDVCSITVTIDEPLSPYLSVRCQGKTLFVSFEEKSVTKEVKKLYSGRNAPKPSFHAVIAMPAVESITICDKVVLNSPSRFEAGIDKFELTVLDEAQVKLLSLSANNAKVNLQKKANVSLNINTENNIEVITEGDSNLNLSSGAGGELVVNASGKSKVSVKNTSNKVNVAVAGNAQVSIAANCNDVIVNAEGSSKLTLTGMGADISVKASKSANVDAYGLQMTEAVIDMAGNAQVSVNASETIEISSTGGKLLFAGSPVFKIVKVSKASILPYGAGE